MTQKALWKYGLILFFFLTSCSQRKFGFRKTVKAGHPIAQQQKHLTHQEDLEEADKSLEASADTLVIPGKTFASTDPVYKSKTPDCKNKHVSSGKAKQKPAKKRGNEKLYNAGKSALGLGIGLISAALTIFLIAFLIVGFAINIYAFFTSALIIAMCGGGAFLAVIGGILMKVSGYKPQPLLRKDALRKAARFFIGIGMVIFGITFLGALFTIPFNLSLAAFVLPQFLFLFGLGIVLMLIGYYLLVKSRKTNN
jgi:hypothetical protein